MSNVRRMATTEDRSETDSGIEIKPVYTDEDVDEAGSGLALQQGLTML